MDIQNECKLITGKLFDDFNWMLEKFEEIQNINNILQAKLNKIIRENSEMLLIMEEENDIEKKNLKNHYVKIIENLKSSNKIYR